MKSIDGGWLFMPGSVCLHRVMPPIVVTSWGIDVWPPGVCRRGEGHDGQHADGHGTTWTDPS
jgi:hypothetical protein